MQCKIANVTALSAFFSESAKQTRGINQLKKKIKCAQSLMKKVTENEGQVLSRELMLYNRYMHENIQKYIVMDRSKKVQKRNVNNSRKCNNNTTSCLPAPLRGTRSPVYLKPQCTQLYKRPEWVSTYNSSTQLICIDM